MRRSISLKIFSVALVILLLMGAVTGISAYFLRQVRIEALHLAHYFVPISQNVQMAARNASAQMLHLDRYASLKRNGAGPERLAEEKNAFEQRHLRFADSMHHAQALVTQGLADRSLDLDATGFARLGQELPKIERAQELLHESLATQLRRVGEGAELPAAQSLRAAESVATQRADVSKAINEVSAQLEQLTRLSADRALELETKAARLTLLVTVIAALLGLGLAALITRSLVHPVRQLLVSTQAVRDGNLDVDVRVKSGDEIATLADSFNHMVGGLKQRDLIERTFGKYVDPRIVQTLIAGREISAKRPANDGAAFSTRLTVGLNDRRRMSMLFSDIEGFTGLSERLPAAQLVEFLNHYFSAMARAVHAQKGIIDKYIGDSVMAFWGAPFVAENERALCACRSALAQLAALDEVQAGLPGLMGNSAHALLDTKLNIRIGIATGEVIVGSIGADTQMNYTVVGDAVNLASRLESANKLYGTRLLVDEETCLELHDTLPTRCVDVIRVVGKAQPTRVFEVLNGAQIEHQEALMRAQAYANQYEAALQLWLSVRDATSLVTARRAFEACVAQTPGDKAAQLMLARIGILETRGIPHAWDGVWNLSEK